MKKNVNVKNELRDKYGEKPLVRFLLEDSTFTYEWRTSFYEKKLRYMLKKCVGCDLCLICPWEAISLGPVTEFAAGRIKDAPLIMIDENKCVFCGICDSTCVFDSIKIDFKNVKTDEEYTRIKGIHLLDEKKCIPCLLCSKVCPREAIQVELKINKKEELVHYPGQAWATGTIEINKEKCSYCGLCSELCDAIKIYWDKPVPPDFKPAIDIRVEEEKCDYCGLCEEICPSEAIKVTCKQSSPRIISKPIIRGKITIDEEKCVDCGLCAIKCPVEALKVEKPFEGKVDLIRLEKCDPVGCNNCFNICPVNAIYPTGDKDKVRVMDEICIYCGACKNACPENVIEVERKKYRLKSVSPQRSWETGRKKIFDALINRVEKPGLYVRDLKVTLTEPKFASTPSIVDWEIKNEKLERVLQERLRKAISLLNSKPHRILFELGKMDLFKKKLKKETETFKA